MYLETIIDHSPDLEIIYHYENDTGATCLETTWEMLDRYCAHHKPYEILLEHYDPYIGDISQCYIPTDLRTWLNSLNKTYKTDLVEQFVRYCQNCQADSQIKFYQ